MELFYSSTDNLNEEGKRIMSTAKIFMRNGLGHITLGLPLRKEELQSIFSVIHVPEPKMLLTNHGIDNLSIIMENEDLNAIINSVKREDIKFFKEDLTSLQITTRDSMQNTKGIMAFIGSLFSENKISIEAAEFGQNEIVLIFEKDTGPKAFYLLNKTIERLKNPPLI